MQTANLQSHAAAASTLLKALSNERRLVILCHLAAGERSVGELERLVGLSQSALSQHLARLRRDHLVSTRRSAQTIYYSLTSEAAKTVLTTLDQLYSGRHQPNGSAGKDSSRAAGNGRVRAA
ncbi:MAG TPA: metalloregulator ArsR/SmtB family transcription factor [Alphaproteobacteria bacterium]|nr:metalloregulator ArsR/SmtB family transcription factor [Alphaproteobacteria bacterium]